MDKDELFDYLIATDQLDDFLGLEIKCPNCDGILKLTDNNELYCENCDIIIVTNDEDE